MRLLTRIGYWWRHRHDCPACRRHRQGIAFLDRLGFDATTDVGLAARESYANHLVVDHRQPTEAGERS